MTQAAVAGCCDASCCWTRSYQLLTLASAQERTAELEEGVERCEGTVGELGRAVRSFPTFQSLIEVPDKFDAGFSLGERCDLFVLPLPNCAPPCCIF